MLKTTLRNSLITKRTSLSQKFVRDSSKKIESNLTNSGIFDNISNVLIYLPINGEVDTSGLLYFLQERHVNISVPAYVAGEWIICSYYQSEKLEKVFRGVLQPKKLVKIDISIIDLIVLPGVAFAIDGARIGMGLAVYDRLIRNSNAIRVGLAYEFQIVSKIDTEEHDISVDYIATEERIIKIT